MGSEARFTKNLKIFYTEQAMGQMGHFSGWVTWVLGRGMVTNDPLLDYPQQGSSQTYTVAYM